jgi:two-component sensor histidine kinase
MTDRRKPVRMSSEVEIQLELENANLRHLLEQAGIDAAQHEVAEKLQRLILEELHHRVKNTLAIVHSISNQSLRSSTDLRQAELAISSRILALGRVHDLLLQANWGGSKLGALLKTAVEPFDTPGAEQFVIHPAEIEISPSAALPLVMTINELCTNAVKYGALSVPEGRIEIATKVDEGKEQLRLTWTERGGPPVQAPTRRSFGMKLIEIGFAGQLSGNAKVSFDPAGVACEFDVPLAAVRIKSPPKG